MSALLSQHTQQSLPQRAGVGLKAEHYRTILESRPAIGFFEVHAENYMGAGGPPHRFLSAIRESYPLSLHGVGLSIGADRPLDRDHLQRLKLLVARYAPGLFSEHLAWSSHDCGFLNDLLPVPYTAQSLARVVDHIDQVQEVLGRQMLLENPSTYLAFEESTYSETDFIAAVTQRTGCGLLLDVNNVYVASINQQWDPFSYIDEYPLAAVQEIHLAGHAQEADEKNRPLLIDTHDRHVADIVWDLFDRVIHQSGPIPTLIEWDSNIPDWSTLHAQAERADTIIALATRPASVDHVTRQPPFTRCSPAVHHYAVPTDRGTDTMIKRQVLVYYAWSRPAENGAPLHVIDDRFPALFESRRMGFPRFHEFSNPYQFDQSIAGFLDHIMKRNFTAFVDLAAALTGQNVTEIERVTDDGTLTPLDAHLLSGVDTLIVISFDSLRTAQTAGSAEIEAIRTFLGQPDHLAFICPHHDIGDVADLPESEQLPSQIAEFEHHGDKTIPPRQRFGGLARSLLAGLGVPVENRFGLRPAAEADGSPAPIETDTKLDRLGLLQRVSTFNLHPHLPQLERLGEAVEKLDVLARQRIDPAAPPHPFVQDRATFDALLQSRPDTFSGSLLVSDTTLWSSTAGGVDSLRELWTNVVQRPRRS